MAAPTRIPRQGVDKAELLETMESFRQQDADWRQGRTWSMVYFAGDEHLAFLKKAHNLFFSENGLNPMAFRSLKRMESEVVGMSAGMLHGGPETVGTMTSGGTESILLAVKTYRDRARAERPWIKRPELVAPETIHVAFDKACHYFDVKLRHAPVGPDYRVDVGEMKRLVNRDTIALAASAPQYPQGVLDPIAEVGALAEEKGLPFHVDACIGGFMLPWVEKLGFPVAPWDFRVPAVTSISADVHKYGYAAKGASVILYRDMRFLRHQFFVATDWSGGIYASPSLPGTRAGGSIAAAWGAMMAMGESGYLEQARTAMEASKKLIEGLGAIPGIEVLGSPVMTIVTYGAREGSGVDVFAVADQLEDKGWSVDRQQKPACIHCTVTGHHLGVIDEYLADVRAAVEYVAAHPEVRSRGNAAMYGMMAKVPFRGMIKKSVLQVMEQMYGASGEFDPSKMAEGASGGLQGKLLERYGETALSILDKLDLLRARLGRLTR